MVGGEEEGSGSENPWVRALWGGVRRGLARAISI